MIIKLDSKEVKYLIENDKKMKSIVDYIEDFKIDDGGRDYEGGDRYFISLFRSILGQQISMKAANSIWNKVVKYFEKITPEAILKTDDELLRNLGLSKSKVIYSKDLCNKILSKEIILDDINKKSDDEIRDHLIKVKGIGTWTVNMFLIFTLFREDVFPIEDLGLRNSMRIFYFDNIEAKKEDLIKISLHWKPYRTYGTLILWEGYNKKLNEK